MFLAAHLDALFDRHLITFVKDSGAFKIKIVNEVVQDVLEKLNITGQEAIKIEKLSGPNLQKFESYMLRHNKVFDEKNS